MLKKSIALFGEWNTNNLGDKAIGLNNSLLFISLGFEVRLFAFGSLEYIRIVRTVEEAQAFFNQSIIDQKIAGGFDLNKGLAFRKSPLLRKLVVSTRGLLNTIRLIKFLKGTKSIVVGGGELLNNRHFQFKSSLYWIAKLSQWMNIPLVCLGCSIPTRSGLTKSIKRFVSQSSIIAVRDNHTLSLLQSTTNSGLSLYGDCAAGNVATKTNLTAENIVGLNIKSGRQFEQYAEVLVYIIEKLTQYGHRCVLYTTGTTEDRIALNQIRELTGEPVDYFIPKNLEELLEFQKTLSLNLCSRLHSGILSLNQSIPTLALNSSDNKLLNYFSTIELDDICVNLDSLNIKNLLVKPTKFKTTKQRELKDNFIDKFRQLACD